MKWRWLAFLSIPVLLTGCADIFTPCASPGAKSVLASGAIDPSPGGIDNVTCLYKLTVTEKDMDSHVIRARVADSAVDQNLNRRNDYFSRQLFSTSWFTDFKREDYHPHEYAFHPDDKNILSQLNVGEDYYFVGIPDSFFLKQCPDKCMQDRQKIIDDYYKNR
jgi:hypothetical protein